MNGKRITLIGSGSGTDAGCGSARIVALRTGSRQFADLAYS